MCEFHVLITVTHAIEALSVSAIVVDCVPAKDAEVLNHLEKLGSSVLDL